MMLSRCEICVHSTKKTDGPYLIGYRCTKRLKANKTMDDECKSFERKKHTLK